MSSGAVQLCKNDNVNENLDSYFQKLKQLLEAQSGKNVVEELWKLTQEIGNGINIPELQNDKIYKYSRPFQNFHIIDDSQIIKNTLELNKDVVNKVILYAPAAVGGWFIIQRLWYWTQKTFNVFGDQNLEFVNNKLMQTVEQVVDDNIPPDMINTAVHTIDFANLPQLRVIQAQNVLKQHMEEMYQGEIVIVGNPNIKPNDYVYIIDTVNKMAGMQIVKKVVHSYSVSSGYVTSISIKPDIETSDLHITTKTWYAVNKIIGFSIVVGLGVLASMLTGGQTLPAVIQQNAKSALYAWTVQHVANKMLGLFGNDVVTEMLAKSTVDDIADGKQQKVSMNKIIMPFYFRFLYKDGKPFQAGVRGQFINSTGKNHQIISNSLTIDLQYEFASSILSKQLGQ